MFFQSRLQSGLKRHPASLIGEARGSAWRELTQRQERQQEELSAQKAQIRSLQVALQGIVTQYEFEKLTGLERQEPFQCYYSDDLYAELKRLRAMGLI